MAGASVTKVIEIDVRQSAGAQAQVQAMARNLASIDETSKKTQAAVGGLTSEFGKMASGMAKGLAFAAVTTGLASIATGIASMIEQTGLLRSKLELVTGSSESAGKAFAEIARISTAQGASLGSIGTLYEKITRASSQMGITMAGVSSITEGFAASLRLSGAGAQQADAAILQFSQALASGKLAGDEFRSLNENNSVFMAELAKAAGLTQGEIRKLSKDGGIDLEFLRTTLFKVGEDGSTMLQRLTQQAAKLPLTFKQAVEGTTTQLANLVDAMFNSAGQSESIFTRMVKAVGSWADQAAREIRLIIGLWKAESDARAGATAAGKPGQTDAEALTAKVKSDLEATRNREMKLTNQLASGVNDAGRPITEAQRLRMEEQRTVLTQQRRVLERDISNEIDKQITKEGKMVTTKPDWVAPPKDPPKAKAAKSEAIDSLVAYEDELMRATTALDEKSDGLGAQQIKLGAAIAKSNLNMASKETKDMIEKLTEAAKEYDYKVASVGWDKDMAKRRKEVMDARVSDSEKLVSKFSGMGAKAQDRVDPLGDMLEKLQEVDALIERINNGDLKGLVKQEDIDQIQYYRDNIAQAELGIDKLKEKTKTLGEEIADAMASSTKEMANSIIDFVTGTEKSFGKLVLNIIKQLASAELQKALNPLMKAAGSGLVNLLGMGSAKTGASAPAASSGGIDLGGSGGFDYFFSKNGNAFGPSGPIDFFAKGGVVNGATGFEHTGGAGVMGEAGAEAIMPLSRDASGKLGVGTAPVSVEINNYSGGKVTQSEGTDENGNKKIRIMIEKAVEEGISNGRYDKVMGNSYGTRRQGR